MIRSCDYFALKTFSINTQFTFVYGLLYTIYTRPETQCPSFIGAMGFPAYQTHTSSFTVISMQAIHFSWLGPELLVCCLAHRGPTGVFLLPRR